jgi:hypothetical protein
MVMDGQIRELAVLTVLACICLVQIGDLFCKPGHMFEMARQNADIIEDETSRGQNPQPVQNLVANDPIGIRLDVYEMSYADEGPLANERIERLLHLDRHRNGRKMANARRARSS